MATFSLEKYPLTFPKVHVGFSYSVPTFPMVKKRATTIKSVIGRQSLIPRREPYYEQLRSGFFIGYRKMSANTEGTWVARCRKAVGRGYHKTSLRKLDHLAGAKQYDAAVEAAERWFRSVTLTGGASVATVKDACEAYLAELEIRNTDSVSGAAKHRDIQARFERWVYQHRIAAIKLSALTRDHVLSWRSHIARTPVVVNPRRPEKDQVRRERSASSVNRDITPLRAALNFAHKRGHAASDIAWLDALTPKSGADGRRETYLTPEHRRALREHCAPQFRPFIEALCLLPLRPGAVAKLTVADFDLALSVLTVPFDKVKAGRRFKVPPETASFLAVQCQSKPPTAPMFSNSDGVAWNKDTWKKPFRQALTDAGLSELNAVTYSLRHSVITDLVAAKNDLLTIAEIGGTSVRMIEKHYGHVKGDTVVAALSSLTLQFRAAGIAES